MKILQKIIKSNVEYNIADNIARESISNIADELNKIEVPDKTSDLENDSGFITSTDADNKYALKSTVDELQLYKFPNATIFGQPTIQNGQVSNFSNDNYLQFPFLVNFQNRPFNIYFSFTTPSVMTGQQNILDSDKGLAFAIREGKVVCVASEDGTSWTTGELVSTETLEPNTTYYFRVYCVSFEGQFIFGYLGGLSTDAYTINKTARMNQTPYPKTMFIGRSFVNNGNHFSGSINLNDASLEVSNKVVWTGMDDVGLATRAAVDLSNIDAKGVEVIETIVDNKVSTKQDILVSGTNIKTINNQSILGEGNITIQGGEGGGNGAQIIEVTSAEYRALTDEEKNDTSKIYVIKDGVSEYYKKTEVYNKTESDAKYSLKGEGKTYTGGSGVTVNNDTNVIGVNAVSGFSIGNSTNWNVLYYKKTTDTTNYAGFYIQALKVNGAIKYLIKNSSFSEPLDLDSAYAKTSDIPDVSNFLTDIKTINGQSIVGTGNVEIKGNDEWIGTQEQYDALTTKSNTTTYYII